MSLCKYSNIFGEPGKGIHSIRLFNVSIVDVIATIFLAILTNFIIKGNVTSLIIITIIWFIIGIISHKLFCVKTTVDGVIFGN